MSLGLAVLGRCSRTSSRPPGAAARDRSLSWMASTGAVCSSVVTTPHTQPSRTEITGWLAGGWRKRCRENISPVRRRRLATGLLIAAISVGRSVPLSFVCSRVARLVFYLRGELVARAADCLPWNRGTRSGSGVSLETRIRLVSSTPSSTARSVVRCTFLFWELWGRDPCGRSGAAVKFPKPRVRKKRKTGRVFFFFSPPSQQRVKFQRRTSSVQRADTLVHERRV